MSVMCVTSSIILSNIFVSSSIVGSSNARSPWCYLNVIFEPCDSWCWTAIANIKVCEGEILSNADIDRDIYIATQCGRNCNSRMNRTSLHMSMLYSFI